jgi:hypothetical protein
LRLNKRFYSDNSNKWVHAIVKPAKKLMMMEMLLDPRVPPKILPGEKLGRCPKSKREAAETDLLD